VTTSPPRFVETINVNQWYQFNQTLTLAMPDINQLLFGQFDEARSYMGKAVQRALQALRENEKCRDLFGTATSRSNGFDPAAILQQVYAEPSGLFPTARIIGGAAVSSGFVYDFVLGGATAQVNLLNVAVGVVNGAPYIGTGVRVDIGVSSWNEDGRAGRFNFQAALLLHELGHLYANQFAGSGGSQIVDDAGSTAASEANFFKVFNSCGLISR
jgi:hypothetical protein